MTNAWNEPNKLIDADGNVQPAYDREPIWEWVHYSDLKVGDIVREGNTNFRVVAEPHHFRTDRTAETGLSAWNVRTVAADNDVDSYFHPFVTKAGDDWSLQYREDLAYTHRVKSAWIRRGCSPACTPIRHVRECPNY